MNKMRTACLSLPKSKASIEACYVDGYRRRTTYLLQTSKGRQLGEYLGRDDHH